MKVDRELSAARKHHNRREAAMAQIDRDRELERIRFFIRAARIAEEREAAADLMGDVSDDDQEQLDGLEHQDDLSRESCRQP